MDIENKCYIFGIRAYKFIAILMLIVVLSLFKVLLATVIYYNSKSVNDLVQEQSVLKAENEMLKRDIEAIKFKTQVSDVIIKSSLSLSEGNTKIDN